MSGARKQDLFIPIYLDTNTLMDMLASVEDGFSVVEKITSSSTDIKSSQQSVKGEIGFAAFLNMFKINLEGEADRKRGQETGVGHSTERYHTYGSLLDKLHFILEDKGLLTAVTSNELWQSAQPSDFVEIRGKFVPNPFRESMQAIVNIIEYWFFLQQFSRVNPNSIAQNKPNSIAQNKPNSIAQNKPNSIAQNDLIIRNLKFKRIRDSIKVMLKDFEPEGIHTYIIEPSGLPENKVVVKLFSEYIRDRTGRELPYGEFRMLGKVIRKIDKGDAIDLIQGSVFSLFGDKLSAKFLNIFKVMESSGVKIPKVTKSIDGPVIQIIPIAVYV